MTTQAPARLTVTVSPSFRDEVKIEAIATGQTVKEYVIEALQEKMQRESDEEDQMLARMFEEEKRGGFLGHEESEELLTRMANA